MLTWENRTSAFHFQARKAKCAKASPATSHLRQRACSFAVVAPSRGPRAQSISSKFFKIPFRIQINIRTYHFGGVFLDGRSCAFVSMGGSAVMVEISKRICVSQRGVGPSLTRKISQPSATVVIRTVGASEPHSRAEPATFSTLSQRSHELPHFTLHRGLGGIDNEVILLSN